MKIYSRFILPFFVTFCYANSYYVETNGSDSNPGTESLPWRTIQKAAITAVAGDTVYIKAGLYNERIIPQNSGTTNNYIFFTNYQNDSVIIDGEGISWGGSWNGLFDISNKSYIRISGLKIINAEYGGFWIENSDHVIINNSYTYNTFSSGIGVWNSCFITINNNEVELACNDGEQECITISNSNNCEISHNNIHNNGSGDNGGEGIDIKQGSHDIKVFKNIVHHLHERIGIYVDAWDMHTYNIDIYQNIVHNCGNNGMVIQSEMGGTVENVSLFNNIVYLNKWDGIVVGSVTASDTVPATPVHSIEIINNTLYKNGGILDGWGFGILVNNPDANNIIIRNNICSENSAQIGIQQINSGGIIDHNLLFGNNSASGAVYGNNSILGDPLFVDPDLFDFHLNNNSPAIDNGSSINAPSIDYDDHQRPQGYYFDIGAYEYYPDVYENEYLLNPINIFPNPASDTVYIYFYDNHYPNYSIQLIDCKGKLIKNISFGKQSEHLIFLGINNVNPGIYVLNILLNDHITFSKKLIIE